MFVIGRRTGAVKGFVDIPAHVLWIDGIASLPVNQQQPNDGNDLNIYMLYFEDKNNDLDNEEDSWFVGVALIGCDRAQYAVNINQPGEDVEIHDGCPVCHRVPDSEAEQHQGHVVLCAIVQVGHCDYGDEQEQLVDGWGHC